jgi:hypothetical protein
MSWKRVLVSPAAVRMRPQLRRRLSGSTRGADPGREDEPVFLPVVPGVGPFGELLAAVLPKRVDAQLGEWSGSCRALGLGPDKVQCAADPLKRLDYFERARVEVDVASCRRFAV